VRPDGREVRCYGPPPESYPTGFHIELGMHIPEFVELIEANLGVEELHTRLREVAPNLLAAEAIEFRLCALAQGVIDEEMYRFLPGRGDARALGGVRGGGAWGGRFEGRVSLFRTIRFRFVATR